MHEMFFSMYVKHNALYKWCNYDLICMFYVFLETGMNKLNNRKTLLNSRW